MRWIFAVMFILWALVIVGAWSEKQWSEDGEVAIVKMGAKP